MEFQTIIVSILGSAAIFGFIQFLISRNDKKHDRLKEIGDNIETLKKDMKKSEKDAIRTQLLVLIAMYPDEEKEILSVAQHYFIDLKSNWYVTPLFYLWCQKHNINPEWFHYEEKSNFSTE